MTKQEAQNLFIESIELLKSMNIPISEHVSTTLHFKVRMSTAFGRCHYSYNHYYKAYSSWIELNEAFVLKGSYQGVRNTILHELLHTIDPKAGHRGVWKSYAQVVNKQLGVNIQRTDGDKTAEDIELLGTHRVATVKYKFECPSCHYVWKYYRYSSKVHSAETGHLYCTECCRKAGVKDERSRIVKISL